MKPSTIIVTYNATQNNWIQKCLDSVMHSTMATDIIVIDNASTDNTVTFVKENYPQVHLIENKENLGFGKANNQGIEAALKNGAYYFFLLNQDATVESNTLDLLAKKIDNNPEYGIISPMHYNGKGDALDYNFSNYIAPSQCKNLYSDFVLQTVEDRVYESGFICAAAWMISRQCIETVGGFSPVFYHYAEDDNYVHRLKFKGLKIGVYPLAKIYHDREERAANIFHENEISRERRLILDRSNPLKRINLNHELKILRRKRMKYLLLGDKTMQNATEKEIGIIKKHQSTIELNVRKSLSDSKFIFLDYSDE